MNFVEGMSHEPRVMAEFLPNSHYYAGSRVRGVMTKQTAVTYTNSRHGIQGVEDEHLTKFIDLVTCVDSFSVSLAASIANCNYATAARYIEKLMGQALLNQKLSGNECEYYFLKSQLEQLRQAAKKRCRPTELYDARRRAASALCRAENYRAALHCALDSGDKTAIKETLEYLQGKFYSGITEEIYVSYELLGIDDVAKSAKLAKLFIRFFRLMHKNAFEAKNIYNARISYLESSSLNVTERSVDVANLAVSTLLANHENDAFIIEHEKNIAEAERFTFHSEFDQGNYYLALGKSCHKKGELEEASQLFDQAELAFDKQGLNLDALAVSADRAYLLKDLGKLEQARYEVNRALNKIEVLGRANALKAKTAELYAIYADVSYLLSDINEAKSYANKSLKLASYNKAAEFQSVIVLLACAMAENNTADCHKYFNQCYQLVSGSLCQPLLVNEFIWYAQLYIHRFKIPRPEWLKHLLQDNEARSINAFTMTQLNRAAESFLILVAPKTSAQMLNNIQNMPSVVLQQRLKALNIVIGTQISKNQAQKNLALAASTNESGIFYTVLSEFRAYYKHRNVSYEILDQLNQKSIYSAVAEALQIDPVSANQDVNAWVGIDSLDLTKKELRIWLLLSNSKSLHSLADEIYVSINTVKSHLKNIYRKLGVAGKREAILLREQLKNAQ